MTYRTPNSKTSSPGDFDAIIDGLRAEDAGGADFVGPFAGLVKHEGEDVLVVGDGDAGLLLVGCRRRNHWGSLTCFAVQAPSIGQRRHDQFGSWYASSRCLRPARANT